MLKKLKKACNLLRFCFTITLKEKAISYHLSFISSILDGCVSVNKGNVLGTYIHGIFDNDGLRSRHIKHLRLKKGLESVDGIVSTSKKIKEEKYNTLADIVRENIGMGMVYKILETKLV